MKTLLLTFNAKYIHTSLALRLLYVANKGRFNLSFREYTIKEDAEKAADDVLATAPDIVGISVYIWNVEQSLALAKRLKQQAPHIILILGGPEVTYDAGYFLQHWPVDYIVKGEGEFALGDLLHALESGADTRIAGVSSLQHHDNTVLKADLKKVEQLPSPYVLDEDIPNLGKRLVYFETSRGCPYQCSYCLSSLENGVRYYSGGYITKNLLHLLGAGAKQIKFLDRTFNLDAAHTRSVFDFLIRNHRPGVTLQFEIYADLLTPGLIDFLNQHLPPAYFRFEIGIQSTHTPANEAVNRRQDFARLADNVKKLIAGGKVALHLDLIAGLPHENMARFIQSFNDVFQLHAPEVQLGFLKMLRGTQLRAAADQYGYLYDECPPYEIISHQELTREELHTIRNVAFALEKFWNSGRFPRTMHQLVTVHYAGRYFQLFDQIGRYHNQQHYPKHAYQLEDIFRCLHDFLVSEEIPLPDLLRKDYYANFAIRPHGFQRLEMEKKERKRLLQQIVGDADFLSQHKLDRRIVLKQGIVDRITENEYQLTLFPHIEKKEPLFINYYPPNKIN